MATKAPSASFAPILREAMALARARCRHYRVVRIDVKLTAMPKGLVFLLIMIAVIIIYTFVIVRQYMRLSDRQWQQVDKSKLRKWDDDDEW